MAQEPTGTGGGATVSIEQIYKDLLAQGFSTIQAIGIMANMMNESSFDPEIQNTSGSNCSAGCGLVQMESSSYPKIGSYVTGNPAADAKSQIGYLASVVSPQALQGTTAAEVAGNFAQYFEACASCQPGGAQYQGRVQNAATVSGWVSSGKWPTQSTSSVNGNSSGTSGSLTAGSPSAETSSACLWQVGLSGVLGSLTGLNACVISKTEVRAILGGLMMGAGGLTMFIGLAVLTVAGLAHSKAGQAAGRAVGGLAEGAGAAAAVAGAPEIGGALADAGRSVRRTSRSGQTQAGAYAQRRRAGSREVRTLQAQGASNIRTAQRPQPAPNKPGRVIGTIEGPGRYSRTPQRSRPAETSGERSRRYAQRGTPATAEEAGF